MGAVQSVSVYDHTSALATRIMKSILHTWIVGHHSLKPVRSFLIDKTDTR